MAEKVEIVDLTINVENANADTRALKIQLQQLKEAAAKTRAEQGELSDEYIEYTAAIKATQKELRTQQTLTQNVIAANDAQTGSIDQLRKQLAVVSVQWAKLSKNERENTEQGKKLTAQKTQLTAALKKEERATGDARRNVGNYNEGIGNSIGLLGQFVPSVGRAATGAKTLGKAFTVALGPIGLIVAAIGAVIGALKAFFTSSEEGQDTFNELWAVVEVVVGNIVDAISALGKALAEPKETLNEIGEFFENTFGKTLVGTFEVAINSIKKFFNSANLLYQKFKDVFTDNAEGIAEAQKDIEANNKAISEGINKVVEGVDNLADAYDNAKESVSEFIEEQQREIAIAQELARRQGNLDRQIRNSLVANARDQARVAELRAGVADKEKNDAEARLKLLNEAIELEEKILERNISIAQQKLFIKSEQNKLSNSTKEDLDEEARLRADVFNVRKANFMALRRLQEELTSARREIRLQEEKAEKEQQAAFEQSLKDEQELLKQQQADIKELNKQAAEASKAQREQFEAQRQLEYDNELQLAQDNIFRRLELEREGLEAQRQQEIEFAEGIGADTTSIEQKYADAREAINRAEVDAKLELAFGFLNNLAVIAGTGTGIAKAAGVAETTINTFVAAQAAYKSLAGIPVVGPVLGIAAAGAALTTGFNNVKKILAVDSGLPGGNRGGGGSTPSISGGGGGVPQNPGAIAPTLNQGIISRDALQNTTQNNVNVQPTLVIDDVTNAQINENANNNTSVI